MIKRFIKNFVANITNKKNNIVFSLSSIVINSHFEGDNFVGKNTKIDNCYIGKMTYFSHSSSFHNAKIGSFCSIGPNVKVIRGEHPTKTFVSTHPCFYSNNTPNKKSYVNKNIFEEYKYTNNDKTISIEIGNDVWIGASVLLIEGITIGDGAIIGAGSVVTKNVPPYSITVGNPAKPIKYRFDDEQIKFLLQNEWWKKSDEWFFTNNKYFSDIDEYIDKMK